MAESLGLGMVLEQMVDCQRMVAAGKVPDQGTELDLAGSPWVAAGREVQRMAELDLARWMEAVTLVSATSGGPQMEMDIPHQESLVRPPWQ
jgi:hypothetical protein